jgi:hypothetical protein
MKDNKNIALWLSIGGLIAVVCFIVSIVSESQKPTVFLSSGIVAIVSAVLGVLLTVTVTSILLKKQSNAEMQKDIDVIVFEKKQKVYHSFLNELKKIIQDGEIKIWTKREDGSADTTVDELKDLIFQLGYLKMHTADKTINTVLEGITEIIQQMNKFKGSDDQQNDLADFYTSLSDELFKIIDCLKTDLYPQSNNIEIGKHQLDANDAMRKIMKGCNLFIVETILDDEEAHLYFWKELGKQLRSKGYKVENENIIGSVKKYLSYGRSHPNMAYAGLYVEIPTLQMKLSGAMMQEEPWYGFEEAQNKNINFELIKKYADDTSGRNEHDGWLFCSDDINFYKKNELFEMMKTEPQQRAKYIGKIAEQLDEKIKKFIKIAEDNKFQMEVNG